MVAVDEVPVLVFPVRVTVTPLVLLLLVSPVAVTVNAAWVPPHSYEKFAPWAIVVSVPA